MNRKPAIFIGSSVENLDAAYALQENLEYEADVTVWSQGVFDLSRSTIESLVAQMEISDFAAFIFSPDDITQIRNVDVSTVRDNVLFELGLFIGHLSRERVYLVIPRGLEGFHLPTDLLGITPANYEPDRSDGNIVAALGPAANRIRKLMSRHGAVKQTQPGIVEKDGVEAGHPSRIVSHEEVILPRSGSQKITTRILSMSNMYTTHPGVPFGFLIEAI